MISVNTNIATDGVTSYSGVKGSKVSNTNTAKTTTANTIKTTTNKSTTNSLNSYEEIDYSDAAVSKIPSYEDVVADTAKLDDEYKERNTTGKSVSTTNTAKTVTPSYETIAAETAEMDAKYKETNNTGKSVSTTNTAKTVTPSYETMAAETAEMDAKYKETNNIGKSVSTTNTAKTVTPSYEEVAAETAKLDAEYRETNNTGKNVSVTNTAKTVTPSYEEVASQTAKIDAEYRETNNTGKNVSNPLKTKQLDYGKVITELENEKIDRLNSNSMTYSYVPDYDRVVANIALQEQKLKERNNTYVATNSNRTYRDIENEMDAIATEMENTTDPEKYKELEKKLLALQYEIERVGVDDYGRLGKEIALETGSTIASGTLSFAKGTGNFVESTIDGIIDLSTAVASVPVGLYDVGVGVTTGNWDFNTINALWDNTMSVTSYEVVNTWDQQLGWRQGLDQWSLIKSDGPGAQIIEGLGYTIGVLATNAAAFGGTAIGAFVTSTTAALGRDTAAAKRAGATNEQALMYGSMNAVYEGLEYYLGYQINGLKLFKGTGVIPKAANSLIHVGLDMGDAGTGIYVDAEIRSVVYGTDYWEEYENLGGDEARNRRAWIGGIASFVSELISFPSEIKSEKSVTPEWEVYDAPTNYNSVQLPSHSAGVLEMTMDADGVYRYHGSGAVVENSGIDSALRTGTNLELEPPKVAGYLDDGLGSGNALLPATGSLIENGEIQSVVIISPDFVSTPVSVGRELVATADLDVVPPRVSIVDTGVDDAVRSVSNLDVSTTPGITDSLFGGKRGGIFKSGRATSSGSTPSSSSSGSSFDDVSSTTVYKDGIKVPKTSIVDIGVDDAVRSASDLDVTPSSRLKGSLVDGAKSDSGTGSRTGFEVAGDLDLDGPPRVSIADTGVDDVVRSVSALDVEPPKDGITGGKVFISDSGTGIVPRKANTHSTDISKVTASDELLGELYRNNDLIANMERDKLDIGDYLEFRRGNSTGSYMYSPKDGHMPMDKARLIHNAIENDWPDEGMISGVKQYSLEDCDYRITMRQSVEIDVEESIAFVKTFQSEANKRGLNIRAKKYWGFGNGADAFILYIEEPELAGTVGLLEDLANNKEYGELVNNATKHFGAVQPFTATTFDDSYYGIAKAHAEETYEGYAGLKSQFKTGRANGTFNSYMDEVLDDTYNMLLERHGNDASLITVDEMYNEMLRYHREYAFGDPDIDVDIPFWMNRRNYLEFTEKGRTINNFVNDGVESATVENGIVPGNMDVGVPLKTNTSPTHSIVEEMVTIPSKGGLPGEIGFSKAPDLDGTPLEVPKTSIVDTGVDDAIRNVSDLDVTPSSRLKGSLVDGAKSDSGFRIAEDLDTGDVGFSRAPDLDGTPRPSVSIVDTGADNTIRSVSDLDIEPLKSKKNVVDLLKSPIDDNVVRLSRNSKVGINDYFDCEFNIDGQIGFSGALFELLDDHHAKDYDTLIKYYDSQIKEYSDDLDRLVSLIRKDGLEEGLNEHEIATIIQNYDIAKQMRSEIDRLINDKNELISFVENTSYGKWFKDLTVDEIETLQNYGGSASANYNGFLRKFKKSNLDGGKFIEQINAIDSAIEKFEPLSTPLELYRGVSINAFTDGNLKEVFDGVDTSNIDALYATLKSLEGETITDFGYMSTSPLTDGAHIDCDIVFDIIAPPGTKGAYIAPVVGCHEFEYLVARGSSLEIIEVCLPTEKIIDGDNIVIKCILKQ